MNRGNSLVGSRTFGRSNSPGTIRILATIAARGFEGSGDLFAHPFLKGRDIVFGHAFGVDCGVENYRDGCGTEDPIAGAKVMEGTDEADGDNGNAELLGKTKTPVFEFGTGTLPKRFMSQP